MKPRQDLALAVRSVITYVPPLYAMSVLMNKIINAVGQVGESYLSVTRVI